MEAYGVKHNLLICFCLSLLSTSFLFVPLPAFASFIPLRCLSYHFVPTLCQLRTSFAPTANQLRTNCLPTSYQLHTNFAPTLYNFVQTSRHFVPLPTTLCQLRINFIPLRTSSSNFVLTSCHFVNRRPASHHFVHVEPSIANRMSN